jgi:flagellin FlaB
MRRVVNLIRKFYREQQGLTGLETAIVLIAFVVVSSTFAFAALSTGLFSADKSKETINAGLSEARGTLELKGTVRAEVTTTAVTRTSVTGEAVGTGDGTTTQFTLANSPVVEGTLTVYVNAVAQTEGTDYTVNYATGVITFTTAPAAGDAITADYTYDTAVGTGDGTTTQFTLPNSPVIRGSQTVYITDATQTVTQVEGVDYTANYDTGVITFTTAPASGAKVAATYTYYTVNDVVFYLANSAGGQAIDLTPGETLLNYMDADTIDMNLTSFGIAALGDADSDNMLEPGELFKVTVPVDSDGVNAGLTDMDEFTIQVKPPQGAVLEITRRIPADIDQVIDLLE